MVDASTQSVTSAQCLFCSLYQPPFTHCSECIPHLRRCSCCQLISLADRLNPQNPKMQKRTQSARRKPSAETRLQYPDKKRLAEVHKKTELQKRTQSARTQVQNLQET